MLRSSPLILCLTPLSATAVERPNVLWISCEDISPRLGCYGDSQAITPNLDQLATEGVRFTQAHHVHGVCAPARTGIITGMYPTSLGCNHMRCKGRLPSHVKPFPHYLREAGYYCTNNSKTDYNFHWKENEVWDGNSNKAHWRDRPDQSQPFFAVFNFTISHESRVWPQNHAQATKDLPQELLHDPEQMELPSYYPDTPKARSSMARLYDVITAMDVRAGRLLEQLEEDGLEDNTIVLFWSDHGDGLPRAKRWVYNSGTRVPLIARIPEKFRHDAYGAPGTTDSRLISMIDLGPTVLRLADVEVPAHMHGQPFLGRDQPAPRQHVYAARDRIDERYDMVRMVRDDRFLYLRTYMPWYPALRLIGYAEKNAIRQEMRRLLAAGELEPEATQFLRATRPFEQLYDTLADPDEVNNLAGDPAYADQLAQMRDECSLWMTSIRDVHLIAEPFLDDADAAEGNRRSVLAGPQASARTDRLMFAAEIVARGGADGAALVELLQDDDPAVRWWGALGLGNDRATAEEQSESLMQALSGDASTAVRVMAARAADRIDRTEEALSVLTAALDDDNHSTRLWAVTVLDEMDERASPALEGIRGATKNQRNNYVQRVAQTALDQMEN
ncbi:MAG: sulfatase-like hydrolase/transferase [Planctomycetota bacterium]